MTWKRKKSEKDNYEKDKYENDDSGKENVKNDNSAKETNWTRTILKSNNLQKDNHAKDLVLNIFAIYVF